VVKNDRFVLEGKLTEMDIQQLGTGERAAEETAGSKSHLAFILPFSNIKTSLFIFLLGYWRGVLSYISCFHISDLTSHAQNLCWGSIPALIPGIKTQF
jgi:hypothetical protein